MARSHRSDRRRGGLDHPRRPAGPGQPGDRGQLAGRRQARPHRPRGVRAAHRRAAVATTPGSGAPGREAVASHATALALWDLVDHPPGPVHVTVDPGRSARGTPGVVVSPLGGCVRGTGPGGRVRGHHGRALPRRMLGETWFPPPGTGTRRGHQCGSPAALPDSGVRVGAGEATTAGQSLGTVAPRRSPGRWLPERAGDLGLPPGASRSRHAAVRAAAAGHRRTFDVLSSMPHTTTSSWRWRWTAPPGTAPDSNARGTSAAMHFWRPSAGRPSGSASRG